MNPHCPPPPIGHADLASNPAVNEINRLHAEIEAAGRTALGKAMRVGELLTRQKAALKHGDWLPWLKSSVRFHEQTARRYMGLYANRDRLKSNNVLDLSAAYRLLAGPSAGDIGAEPALATMERRYAGEAQGDRIAAAFAKRLQPALAEMAAAIRSSSPRGGVADRDCFPEFRLPGSFAPPASVRDLDIDAINDSPARSLRAERFAWHAHWLAAIHDVLDPVAVFDDGVKLWLADGCYRLDVFRDLVGAEQVRARVYTGSENDAAWYGIAANAVHGIALSARHREARPAPRRDA